MANSAQHYGNHRRFRPAFHFVVAPIFLINLVLATRTLIRQPNLDTVWGFVLAFGFVMLGLVARTMALSVQDRLIRLEMELRLRRILPADLQAKIPELRPWHLVALRFAGDDEMPELCREVLAGSLTSPNAIKKRVKNWQGDYLRA